MDTRDTRILRKQLSWNLNFFLNKKIPVPDTYNERQKKNKDCNNRTKTCVFWLCEECFTGLMQNVQFAKYAIFNLHVKMSVNFVEMKTICFSV